MAILAAILDDVTGPQQHPNPYYVPHLVENIKGFLPKAKSLQNIETQQKPRAGVPSTPPPPLYLVTLLVRPRVNCQGLSILLRLLAVRLNELELSLVYTEQNKLTLF